MTDLETTPPEPITPKRRSLRLSIRALMVVVLVLAVGLGWYVNRVRTQRDAVAAIEKAGSSVGYDYMYPPNGPFNPKAEPVWPKWLVERLGVDCFDDVVFVNLGKTATDAEMEQVGRLRKLRFFRLQNGAAVTDAGAAHLAGLNELTWVDLTDTKLTGAALKYLRGKTKLGSLNLSRMRVSDGDLENIKGLTNLGGLNLSSTQVTDAGLVHLEGLTKLQQLWLDSTSVEGPGLAHLKGMNQMTTLSMNRSKLRDLSSFPPLPKLQAIALSGTSVDDNGLAVLSKLLSLETLSLNRTRVTDAGVAHLLGLKASLKVLVLDGPQITDASASTLSMLEKLTSLDLARTNLTDTSIDQIILLKGLKSIGLDGTNVTDAGLARLRKAHPELKFNKDPANAARARNQARAKAASKAQPKNAGPQP